LEDIPDLIERDIYDCDCVSDLMLVHERLVLSLIQESDARIEARQVNNLEPPVKISSGIRFTDHLYMNDWEAEGIRSLLSWLEVDSRVNFLVLYSHYLEQKVFYPYSFNIVSSLNGCNGEWTNSDDRWRMFLALKNLFFNLIKYHFQFENKLTFGCILFLFALIVDDNIICRPRLHGFKERVFVCGMLMFTIVCFIDYFEEGVNLVIKLIEILSQLNGNNGEWTNTDDQAARPNANDQVNLNRLRQLARDRREARNHQHLRPVNQPLEGAARRIIENQVNEVIQVPEPEVVEEIITEYYVYSDMFPYVIININGINHEVAVVINRLDPPHGYLLNKHVLFMLEGNFTAKSCTKNTVSFSNIIENNNYKCCVLSGICFKRIESFTDEEMEFVPAREYIYFKPLLEAFNMEFGRSCNPKIVKLHQAYIEKKFSNILSAKNLLLKTISFRSHMCKYDAVLSPDWTRIDDSFTDIGNFVKYLEMDSLPPQKIHSCTDDIPIELDMKQGVSITHCRGFNDETMQFDTNNIQTEKFYKTAFFKILGEVDFKLYDDNPTNIVKAVIKRMLNKRDDEDFLSSVQVRIAYTYLCTVLQDRNPDKEVNLRLFIEEKPFLAQFKINIDNLDRGFIIIDGHNYDIYDHAETARDSFVLKQVSLDVKNCTPSIISRVANAYNNTTSAAYDCVTNFKESLWNSVSAKLFGSETLIQQINDHILLEDSDTRRDAVTNVPHIKKKLRRQFFDGVELHLDDDPLIKKCQAKFKNEWAKTGKHGRMFVSYDEGSICAPEIIDMVKVGLVRQRKLVHANGITHYIFVCAKPYPGQLTVLFNLCYQALTMQNTVISLIYSDDSVVCGNINSVPFAFNEDVSTCDTSNRTADFMIVHQLVSNFSKVSADAMLKQCCMPMIFTNPHNKAESFRVNFPNPFEGSGHTWTTILNHMADLLIHYSFSYSLSRINILDDDINIVFLTNLLTIAAQQVGYNVTLESCNIGGDVIFEKVQFLKHSPIFSSFENKYISVLNYGCIFRSFGTVDYDLTPQQIGLEDTKSFERLTNTERANLFFSAVIKGLVNEPESPVLLALRTRFCLDTTFDVSVINYFNREISDKSSGNTVIKLDIESLCRRYDTTPDEIEELSALIANLKCGHYSRNNLISKFYRVDYGLE
jgi:hypothetical protein